MRAVAYVAHRRISTLKLPSGEGSHQRHRLANGGRNPQYYCSRVAVAVRSTRPHGAAGGTIQCSKSQSCLTVSSTTLFTPWPTDHHVLIQSGRDQRYVERMEQRFPIGCDMLLGETSKTSQDCSKNTSSPEALQPHGAPKALSGVSPHRQHEALQRQIKQPRVSSHSERR